jgi:predicted PurR-regulated permease PerM
MIQKYKHEIILIAAILSFSIVFYFLYGLLLPFILGLLLVFLVHPVINRIQKIVRSRNLANTIFLLGIAAFVFLFFLFFTQYINRDFKRLSQSFTVLVSANKDNLDKTGQKVKEYIGNLYDFEELERELESQSDSLKSKLKKIDSSKLDTESIKSAFQELTSIFHGEEKTSEQQDSGFGFIFILYSTILYFILILYNFDYFDDIRKRYLIGKVESKLNILIDDFNQSFVRYFKLRSKIVLLLALMYLTTFIIIDIPGLILFTLFIVLLSYVPYLQYIALIPLALGCLVLSVETNQSFLLYYGIVVGVFILASIVEEVFLTPKIMEENIGMNPVIMILALSVWGYMLGLQGLLLGIPLTSFLIIYFKRYVLTSYQEVLQEENNRKQE